MLETARNQSCPIAQASTPEIYGDPLQHPQIESYWGNVNPIGPRTCYNEGKRAAETLCSDFKRQHGTDARIVRIFNTYCPRMDASDGCVASNFIVQALRGDPITLFGDGSQTRLFCFVDDFVDGLMKVMQSDILGLGPINLGTPSEYFNADLAKAIIDLTQSQSRLTYMDLPMDDPQRRKPDIEYAQNLLGWSPHVRLFDGLQRAVRFFEAEHTRQST